MLLAGAEGERVGGVLAPECHGLALLLELHVVEQAAQQRVGQADQVDELLTHVERAALLHDEEPVLGKRTHPQALHDRRVVVGQLALLAVLVHFVQREVARRIAYLHNTHSHTFTHMYIRQGK